MYEHITQAPLWQQIDRLVGRPRPKLLWLTLPNREAQEVGYTHFCERFGAGFHHETLHLLDVKGHSLHQVIQQTIQSLKLPEETALVLHLLDLEWVSTPDPTDPDGLPRLLGTMNFERELLFQDIPATVVFWSYPSSTLNVQRYAQDFWDWVVYKFDFGEKVQATATVQEVLRPQVPLDLPYLLTEPPPNPPLFMADRGNLLERLHQKLMQEPVLVLNGVGGLGKTTVCLAYIQRYKQVYRHLVWLQVGQSLELAVVSSEMGKVLEVPFESGTQIRDQFWKLWTLLDQIPGPNLLVCDDIRQFADLDSRYWAFRNWQVLISSRLKPRHLPTLRLKSLDRPAAKELLKDSWPDMEDSLVLEKDLLKFCDGNPLLIGMVGENLAQAGDQALSRARTWISDDGKVQDTGDSFRAQVGEIIQAQDFSEEALQLLVPLALLPAKFYPHDRFQALLPDRKLREQCLKWVEQGGLDYEEAQKAFKMHALVQGAFRRKYTPFMPYCRDWVKALSEKLNSDSLDERLDWLEEASAMAQEIRELDEDLARLHRALFDTYFAMGNVLEAQEAILEALSIFEKLEDKLDQAWVLVDVGDVQAALGQLLLAGKSYEQSLKIAESLAAANPHSEQLQRDLSVSYNQLGDLAQARGESQEAQERYEQSLKIRESLAAANPHSEQLQRDLSVSYNKLGDLAQARGESQEAQERYEQSLKIAESLAAANPHSEQLQRDLSVSLEKLGDLAQARGESQEAQERYEQSLKIRESLAAANPHSVQLLDDKALSFYKLAQVWEATGQAEKADRLFQQAEQIWDMLAQATSLPRYRNFLDIVLKQRLKK